jgi:TatD DNase family protein
MQLIDIGANLGHTSFAHDLPEVIARAQQANVAGMVVTGASAEGSVMALEIAKRYPGYLYATAGMHPHHASEYDAFAESLFADLLRDPRVLAAGECGLDYNRNFSPAADQQFAFERQLALAIAAKKPVFLHQRDAHADFMAILRNARPHLRGAVVHCFTGTNAELDDYLALDCHIGITGWICDERRGLHLQDSVKRIPSDRLMLETDAPYLLPRTLKPLPKDRRNEPKFLPHIVAAVAHARAESAAALAASSTQCALQFFGFSLDTQHE